MTRPDFDPFWLIVIVLVIAALWLVSHLHVIWQVVRMIDAGVR